LNHDSMNVAIVGNFDVVQKTVTPNFQNTGWWYNYFYGDSVNVTNTQMTINLQPGEFRIYTTKKLPTPEPGLLTSVESTNEILPAKFELYQNYPNPFNPVTYITYDLPVDTKVQLKIYNTLGQEVTTIVDEFQKAGSYLKSFDATELSSGVYFYRLLTENFVSQKKMIVIK